MIEGVIAAGDVSSWMLYSSIAGLEVCTPKTPLSSLDGILYLYHHLSTIVSSHRKFPTATLQPFYSLVQPQSLFPATLVHCRSVLLLLSVRHLPLTTSSPRSGRRRSSRNGRWWLRWPLVVTGRAPHSLAHDLSRYKAHDDHHNPTRCRT